jgi:hypothetical protein
MHARHTTRDDGRADGHDWGGDGDRRRTGRRSAIGPPGEQAVERATTTPLETVRYGDPQHETPDRRDERRFYGTPQHDAPESNGRTREQATDRTDCTDRTDSEPTASWSVRPVECRYTRRRIA